MIWLLRFLKKNPSRKIRKANGSVVLVEVKVKVDQSDKDGSILDTTIVA